MELLSTTKIGTILRMLFFQMDILGKTNHGGQKEKMDCEKLLPIKRNVKSILKMKACNIFCILLAFSSF